MDNGFLLRDLMDSLLVPSPSTVWLTSVRYRDLTHSHRKLPTMYVTLSRISKRTS
uniref:Uncharacterized protein n=1 Tax=Anguilla anguilla TaxID=7936 RepID=A0A0E9XJE5_ANGAN